MLVLLPALVAIGVFVAVWAWSAPVPQSSADILEERLQTYKGATPMTFEEIELRKPFSERVMRPALARLGTILAAHTPEHMRLELQRKLNLAGRPLRLSPTDFMVIRYTGAVLLCLGGVGLGLLILSAWAVVVLGVLGGALGLYGPLLWLQGRVNARKNEIQVALPDAMDLLSVAVEAGLNFEAAMARVAEKHRNPLATEFAQVLRETRLGRPRLEALDDMGRRCGVEDLHNFVQAIIQSEQLGSGIGKILRLQSDEIRRRRRQRAQERGARASLKMLLPMIGCIFPTLWVILLGPALLTALKAFGR
jgi:tight adherence protein C